MHSSDKLKKLDSLAEKLAGAKVFLGSDWAKTRKNQHEIPEIPSEKKKDRGSTKLEDLVTGQPIELPNGKYYHIRKGVQTVWPEATVIVNLYRDVFLGSATRLNEQDADPALTALVGADPSAVTYLDIESCGFCGNAIFLIGWCFFDGSDLIVEQALARDYAEEAAILSAVSDRLAQTQVLVTYNGKTFDLPSIRERAVIHRQQIPSPPTHLDILAEVRRRWKQSLPNCQLQTLEHFLCHRPRSGDIPGSAIPQAYHDFVKTLDARKIKTIIHHNFLDIITLAEIAARLIAGHQPEY